MASNPTGDDIKIEAARYGIVNVAANGTDVSYVSGQKFTGIANSSTIFIENVAYTVSSVTDATNLVLTGGGTGGALTSKNYLAQRGGMDGNMIDVESRSATATLDSSGSSAFGSGRQNNKQLSGGNSNVTWTISLDFTALGIDDLRQCWLTLAPLLANGAVYPVTEFTALVTNWSVSDPSGNRPLKVSGTGSVYTGNRDSAVTYAGSGWSEELGFFWKGQARNTSTTSDSVTIVYNCSSTHNVYVGTSLYVDRGIVDVTLDGDSATELDSYLNVTTALVARRLVRSSIAAGEHTVVITHKGTQHGSSSGFEFYFDFLTAAVETDVIDAPVVSADLSPAIDWDTDATYKITPQRLLFYLERLGFEGDINEFVGVFFWNQRIRAGGSAAAVYDVTFGGTWAVGDDTTLTIGGTPLRKTVRNLDIDSGDVNIAREILATTLASEINYTFVGVWAEVAGANNEICRVHLRTPLFKFTTAVAKTSSSGTVGETADLTQGTEGIWTIDETITPKVNVAVKKWHENFYVDVNALGWTSTAAFSMELLNPPDDPSGGKVWAARFKDGTVVRTATGFGTEGECSVTDATNATPIVITTNGDHGYSTGDSIVVSGVDGNDAANGTFVITVLTSSTFELDDSVGDGTFSADGDELSRRNLKTTHCSFVSDMVDYQKVVYEEFAEFMDAATLEPWLQFGEFLWWFFSSVSRQANDATNASPIEITATAAHGFATGDTVIIAGVKGNTAANGHYVITVTSSTKFTLDSSTGNGAYVSGGQIRGGSMAYYDDDTDTDANVVLSRDLEVFHTQEDDPTVNSSADANFLADQLKDHIDTIRAHVDGEVAGVKYELLWAEDVNHANVYSRLDVPFPQGGRLNRHVNLPSAFEQKAGSGLDRLKMEALSWSVTYRTFDKAIAAQNYPFDVLSWDKADMRVLIAWFNGGTFWKKEYLHYLSESIPHANFWAYDHFILFHLLRSEFPAPRRGAKFI